MSLRESSNLYTGLPAFKASPVFAEPCLPCMSHLDDFCQLQEIWKDLEMPDVVQEQTLQDVTKHALGVWNGAVDHAEHRYLLFQIFLSHPLCLSSIYRVLSGRLNFSRRHIYSVLPLLKYKPSAHLLCASFLLSILDIAVTDLKCDLSDVSFA
jgi:hypothetical protein